MKLVLLFSVVLILGLTYGIDDEDRKAWKKFKETYNKLYTSWDEEVRRRQTFLDNQKRVEEHNKKYEKGEADYRLEINRDADMTYLEFYNNFISVVPPSSLPVDHLIATTPRPK